MTLVYYFSLNNQSKRIWRNIEDRTVSIQFSEEMLRFKTYASSADARWEVFKKVVRTKDFWFLSITGIHSISIPVICLDEELKELIKRKIKK